MDKDKVIQELVEISKAKGYIAVKEILKFVSDETSDFDDVVAELEKRQVDVVDGDEMVGYKIPAIITEDSDGFDDEDDGLSEEEQEKKYGKVLEIRMKNLFAIIIIFISLIIFSAGAIFASPYYFYSKILKNNFLYFQHIFSPFTTLRVHQKSVLRSLKMKKFDH